MIDILVKSIYTSSKKVWSSVIQPSFEQITKALLFHVKQDILPSSTINRVSKQVAFILFDNISSLSFYLDEFLNIALLRLSKSSWADHLLARISICTVIHAQGLLNDRHSLSTASIDLILKYTKRIIGTWSDPTFIKHGTSRERTCK